MSLLKLMSTVAVILLLTPAAHAGQVLSGRVCDYLLSTKTKTVGIPGVTVSVLQGEQAIATQATSKDGSYAFAGLPSNTPLKIQFERAGYERYPTIKAFNLKIGRLKMADVFLLKTTEASAYDRVADRLKERLRREGAIRESEIALLNEFGLEAGAREAILAMVEPPSVQPKRFDHSPRQDTKARLAVLEFKNKADNQWWYKGGAESAQDVFVTELVKSGKFRVVEREQLAALMLEKNLTLSGDVDPATAVRIGKLLGVKYLLTGSVTEYGNTNAGSAGYGVSAGKKKFVAAMTARLIDTSTGEIVWADEARAEEASVKVSVFGVGGGVDDERMFDKVMKPVIQDLAASLRAADL